MPGKSLPCSSRYTMNLPGDLTTFLYSSHNTDFQAAENRYFCPVSKPFEPVDSFIKPNLLFQMPGAEDHPCKLLDVLQILGNPQERNLYFVKPPDRFANFTYQSYLGVLSEDRILTSVKKISQFVLTYDLSK